MAKKSLWLTYSPEMIQKMNDFCEGYKQFMSVCKTERECVNTFIEMAEKAGYQDLYACVKEGKALKAGDKVWKKA